jgi:lipoprotein Spr
MWIQNFNRNLILYALPILLGSCSSLKNISFPLNKGNQSVVTGVKKNARTMEFLEDISVTPGKITINNASDAVETEKTTVINKNYEMMPVNLSDIEKANWLQIKYSLKMDIAVEEIKNIPLLQKIDEWWGTPYVLGGNSKNGVDCSYFTLDVMRDIYKVNLKRTAAEQYEQSVKIEWNNLKEGDLIFFKTEGRRRISHVGIYLANNKFAHASTSQGVTIGDLTDPYWQRRLYSLGRTNPQ